ncbi:MAG: hypothetical protein JXA68_05110, partial [Ignavibacteriales bacterium]|nr:hypothetical protein [Ignavibacteriales bacterium]
MKSTTYIIILLSIIINSIILCQDFKGIHQKDMEAFGLSLKEPSLFNPDGKDIIPLSINKIDNLSHTIFGYLPDWEYQYRSYLRYDLVTHIGCFDFVVA